jgi:hypothetical protein
MELAVAFSVGDDVGVVPRCDRVEAQVDGLLEEGRELDALVAAHARIRRAPRRVFGDEVIDHVGLEPLGEVPDVVRDADLVRDALRIHRVFDGAAAARARAERAGHPRQCEVHPHHIVPRFDRARRGDRGVDPATHCC